MARIKDTDYLAISARVRAMETTLMTPERMERLLEAHSEDEVTRLLQDCGYPALDAARPERMDAALSEAREALLADLGGSAPDAGFIDIFKLKYDYHNAKAVLKAAAVGTDPARMFMDMGRIPASELKSAMESSELDTLPGLLPEAVAEAKNVLDTTRDPQLSDITLDGWMYRDMARTAERTGSAFLRGYVAAQIDAANLRSLIRTLRMGKNAGFLAGALLEGGETEPAALLAVAENGGSGLAELYAPTRFAAAAEAGAAALKGGTLTEFEKQCDDAVTEYLSGAQMVPFGEAPLSCGAGNGVHQSPHCTHGPRRRTGRGHHPLPAAPRNRLRRETHGSSIFHRRGRRLGVRDGLSGTGTGHLSRHLRGGGAENRPRACQNGLCGDLPHRDAGKGYGRCAGALQGSASAGHHPHSRTGGLLWNRHGQHPERY